MNHTAASQSKKIIYLTAGAAGMYCGSCLHDNTLARGMLQQGWNIQLVPTYTPIRTDESDISIDQVLFGGLNVFLQQKIPLFRYLPFFLDRFLDNPKLIRRVTARAIDTDAKTLGGLAVSMLKGVDGFQRKEVKRSCHWLQQQQPDLLILTNLLIGGCLPYLKSLTSQNQTPVLVTLQGDDVFLDGLKPEYRKQCLQLIQKIIPFVDGFVTHTEFYREMMAEYFEIPLEKIFVTPLGIDVNDFKSFLPKDEPIANDRKVETLSPISTSGRDRTNSSVSGPRAIRRPRAIGYLARLAPEKGLHRLLDAFIELKRNPEFADVRLEIAGWLGPPHQKYAESQWRRLEESNLKDHYRYWGAVDRNEKLNFLKQIDLLCATAEFLEPKGLYVLEAMAAGVPVVAVNRGSFPEIIQASQGGVLYKYDQPESLIGYLKELLGDADHRAKLGRQGQQHVHQFRNTEAMVAAMGELINRYLS